MIMQPFRSICQCCMKKLSFITLHHTTMDITMLWWIMMDYCVPRNCLFVSLILIHMLADRSHNLNPIECWNWSHPWWQEWICGQVVVSDSHVLMFVYFSHIVGFPVRLRNTQALCQGTLHRIDGIDWWLIHVMDDGWWIIRIADGW